ncbi:RNA polymerase sigma factor [Mycobacteroides immunogenum]|uniref:RNA polymerase subunit sigma-24 n=1 Tax=Mycobacteroides immunogenum TaxID=83262 RepID=A0A7V8RYV5_9MYCO|nr:sigma-70 family RNA polymerase sigma factor [Mycobacteroides immunogenum]AMT73040.1 RNA polymerase subunit sigma-24 [Mycobacteroides immunogenum]ANO06198.1 RNA polymerase subunit sigma-24 [Mycobacteroides immunogenum]KIU41819.1 RNA polymerase subunit sigma-24 [Mycobacteroides immunogenum]KPG11635.1 RNA polymerase subunit sigma-24 [Mycobacteroides immunogenum]KPG11877.1 RNA polymerase subunit sigma-24 [Mycobacteroides immunogenum]
MAHDEIGRIFREEHGRTVATLIRYFGSIDIAEEAVQEAFEVALATWPPDGIPPNPGAWITTTARNRGIDKLRRDRRRDELSREASAFAEPQQEPEDVGPVRDDRLRLIFTCCHPALAQEAQVALTLRLLGGLTTVEIANAYLVSESTMAARITRAKKKITSAGIPYRVPADHDLPDRLTSVLAALYLIYNEGYAASSGTELTRTDLAAEAIRLARVLVDLMPDEPEVLGLLALVLLTEARRPARTDDGGALVLLADQDRTRWNRPMIAEGHELVRRCLRRNAPGPYQIQAAINAVHDDAPSAAGTDWGQIVTLYDQLMRHTPTTVVALNRAVAVAERDGAQAGLDAIESLRDELDGYYPLHAARADLLSRLHRDSDAADAYRKALELTDNEVFRGYLGDRLARVEPGA